MLHIGLGRANRFFSFFATCLNVDITLPQWFVHRVYSDAQKYLLPFRTLSIHSCPDLNSRKIPESVSAKITSFADLHNKIITQTPVDSVLGHWSAEWNIVKGCSHLNVFTVTAGKEIISRAIFWQVLLTFLREIILTRLFERFLKITISAVISLTAFEKNSITGKHSS